MNFFTSWNHTAPPSTGIPPVTDDDEYDDDNVSTSSSSVSTSSSNASLDFNMASSSSSNFDTVRAMCQQEKLAYQKVDPLRGAPLHHEGAADDSSSHVDEICRFKMCEWSFQIVDFCKFHRESVDIAMNYLDRFLLTKVGQAALQDRNVYQLVAMTCLYSAIKIHERQALSPAVVSQLSRGVYTAEQVIATEVTLLHALQWKLHPPTAFSFVRELLAALPSHILSEPMTETILEVAQKQTEFAVADYRFIEVPMSTIAYCSIMNALQCRGHCVLSTNDIGTIRTSFASAIGLTDADSVSPLTELEAILQTVCPGYCSRDDPLDYSTSTLDMDEIVESSHEYRNDCSDRTRTKHPRRTTFDTSPRSSATTVAVSTKATI